MFLSRQPQLRISQGVFCARAPVIVRLARRRTLLGDFNLAVPHDDDGVLYKGMLFGTCVAGWALLTGSFFKRRHYVRYVVDTPLFVSTTPKIMKEIVAFLRPEAVIDM